MSHQSEPLEVPNGENMPWYKRLMWIVVTAVISAIAGCIAGHAEGKKSNQDQVAEAQARKEKLELELAKQKQEEERQQKENDRRRKELDENFNKKLQEWQKSSLMHYLDVLSTDLEKMMEAQRRYNSIIKEIKDPKNENVVTNKKALISAARATIENVKKYREIIKDFQNVLDGQVDKLEEAIRAEDFDTIDKVTQTLERALRGTKKALLDLIDRPIK